MLMCFDTSIPRTLIYLISHFNFEKCDCLHNKYEVPSQPSITYNTIHPWPRQDVELSAVGVVGPTQCSFVYLLACAVHHVDLWKKAKEGHFQLNIKHTIVFFKIEIYVHIPSL